MKKLLLLVAAVVVSASAFAQTTVEDKLVKLDVGFGSAVGGIPVGVSYEQGIVGLSDGSFITVGGYIGYEQSKDSYYYHDWKRSCLAIMVQGNYYLKPMVKNLDLYAGLRLGYCAITSKYIYTEHSVWAGKTRKYSWGSPFGYSVHVGANYWFNDFIGVNAEFGYGIAYANIGVGFKF